MDGMAWAAAAMSAARARLDVAAENLANGSTGGFRRSVLHGALTAWGVALRRSLDASQGAMRRTGRDFDLALVGTGTFRLRDAQGRVTQTRSGAFVRDRFGRLLDDRGRMLLGAHGPLVVPQGAAIEENGAVVRAGITLDRLPLPAGSAVQRGFLETSNVDAISEMIDLMSAQRSFETAAKVVSAIDQARERGATQVAALKS
jgi:flagellar basal-body rod protein FlgF